MAEFTGCLAVVLVAPTEILVSVPDIDFPQDVVDALGLFYCGFVPHSALIFCRISGLTMCRA